MSSTPLSGNVIRSPNGAPSLCNKTNPSLDTTCATFQTRDQHIIVTRLILFVYMKTQGGAFPSCAAIADIIGSNWMLSVKIGEKSEAPYVVMPSDSPPTHSLYIKTCSCYSSLSGGTSPEAHEGLVTTSGKHSDSALLLSTLLP